MHAGKHLLPEVILLLIMVMGGTPEFLQHENLMRSFVYRRNLSVDVGLGIGNFGERKGDHGPVWPGWSLLR